MPTKIGFSTSVCPEWDIHQIATRAGEMGFYGVELGTVRDEIHLPVAEDLQSDADVDSVRKLFEDNAVEIVSLASIYSFEAREKNVVRRSFERTVENIELASKLGCPFVRVSLGKGLGRESADAVLARQIPLLSELARIAMRNRVTLLMCNSYDFPSSRAVWFVVDGVGRPGLACAWNPMLGATVQESDSIALPRLGSRIRMVQMGDGQFNGRGRFEGYSDFGSGSIDHELTVDLLKGVLFDGYLMLDWPKVQVEALRCADEILPEALDYLLARIKHAGEELTAYKKDKYAANWAGARASFVEREVAVVADEAVEVEAEGASAVAEGGALRVPKGGDPRIAALVAEAVKKVRAARAAKGG